MTSVEENCSHKSTTTHRFLDPLESENRIPGHTRECSLRSVSPLMDTDLINRKLLPTDSADTVIAQQFAKRYEMLRRENESLRQTVIRQDEQIERLKAIIKSLQSDGYSSESRIDKSTSSSTIPTLRVSPQKRNCTSSSTQTPRSPRSSRRAARRLQFTESSESESTPTQRTNLLRGLTNSRIIERTPAEQQFELITEAHQSSPHNQSLRSLQTEINSPSRTVVLGDLTGHRRTRPVAVSRTISSQDITSQSGFTPVRAPVGFTSETNERTDLLAPNPVPNLAFYLQQFRPNFVRNSQKRQEIIRLAAAHRAEIEAARKEIAKKVSNGEEVTKGQQEILLSDSTQIRAFTQKEMSQLSKKKVMNTTEYVRKVERKEFEKERRANRVLAEVHSERTRRIQVLNRRRSGLF